MDTAIKTENLSKTFKGKKGIKVDAVKNLNLEVQKGEVFGFLGPNGAGKSTTIKLLMGLISPTSGCFLIDGIEGVSLISKKMVGYLPENPSFYDYLSGEELLGFVGRTFGMKEENISERAEHFLKLLDLYDASKRPLRSYSKGMVQRLGLVQCLLHNPDIFILDEPMSGLDPLGRMLVRDIILDLKAKGKCIFMSTHILNDIETICDRVGIIVKGELKLVESLQNIMGKGIRGYRLTFNAISGHMIDFLRAKAEEEKVKEDIKGFHVKQQDIETVLFELSKDKETSIQLIEPVRKGLEELFAEIVYEG